MRSILDDAGFWQVGIAREAVDIIGSTPAEEATFACLMGPSGALLDEHQADEAMRRAIRQDVAATFAPYAADGPMLLPATVFVVTARRRLR